MPDSTITSLSPVVMADGAALPDEWLVAVVELRVRRAIRTIGRCSLRFSDPSYRLASASLLKVGVSLRVMAKGTEHGATAVAVFEGKVTSTGVETRDGGQPELIVVAEDLAYELSRSARAATYLQATASDIIGKVVTASGARHQVDATTGVLAYTLQTDTDLAFIDELCRRNGLDWEVEGTTFHAWTSHNGSTLSENAKNPVAELEVGSTLREFSAKVHGDAPQSVTVRGWDHLNKKTLVGESRFERKGVPDGLSDLLAASSIKTAKVLDAQAGPIDPADASALAKVASSATGTVLARGTCLITPVLRPGVMVKVNHAGPASGTYYVREVEHIFRPSGFHTTFVAGDRDPGSLVADHGAPASSSFRHDGLVVGLVSAISNDPESAGRVKVSLPGLDTTIESQWARLAVLGGGAKRGMVFLPEINDEVLVAFEGGDVRRPVVLGGLFGKKDTIPTELVGDANVEHRRITSRLGHVVELADGTGPSTQHILLALAGNEISLRLGKDRADVKLPSGVPLKIVSGESSIELDGNGAITLSGTTIALKGQQKVTIEGMEVTAKATTKFAASGAQVEVKGEAMATFQASGITAVKGSMVQIN
ncbi:phage-related baseplate assembly protein [mine drainage metagenome]|uniref:Phage-related baseplate assembly protein n=1 Tax=mine drainage metagenome TaxID=410659 RepID=A0A1J5QNV3_9ZZZZ